MNAGIISTIIGVGCVQIGTLIYMLGGMRATQQNQERELGEHGQRIKAVESDCRDTAVRVGTIEGRMHEFS